VTPIGAPSDGLFATCRLTIKRGDTVRVNEDLLVVHWDCSRVAAGSTSNESVDASGAKR
jgi:hypothetical protein